MGNRIADCPVAGFDEAGLQVASRLHCARTGKCTLITCHVQRDAVMKRQHALARRLIDRQDDYLYFTQDWRISLDNNDTKHDIRMIKLWQKVPGCLRSLTGARQFCVIRNYLSTAAKHFFYTLLILAEGRPWPPVILYPNQLR